jgi:ABC-type branched-subunit amino acid transport system substrate-binding protein
MGLIRGKYRDTSGDIARVFWRNALNKLMTVVIVTLTVAAAAFPSFAQADKRYGPGVTDSEIKLGQTMPYSGPASSLSLIGKVQVAYFKMINAQGGVNGRKINLISLDDGFNPAKTVEQTRKLVEGEEVLAIFSTEGSAPNLAIAKYMNSKRVPQLLGQAGSPRLVDSVNLPWTTTFYTTSSLEGKQLATFLLETKADAKVGINYQNDDNGRSYLEGMKAGLGEGGATMVVKEVGFDLSYPTIDSQILSLQAAGADTVFFATTTPKFVAQGIRSGRIEARTGLRMMPTFPRPPLSFRTAGFPQYGWKVGFSDGAFLTSTRA